MSRFPATRSSREQIFLKLANKLHRGHSSIKQALEKDNALQVVCVSDTHNSSLVLPPGDLLLHCGDLSGGGTYRELQAQLDWLNEQPHEHKVVIAGNHDRLLDGSCNGVHPDGGSRSDLIWGDLIYLEDATADLTFSGGRTLKVYGNPHTPRFGNFAFQYPPPEDYWKDKIPEDVDIVMTHGPPMCHLDANDHGIHAGCASLLNELYRVKPKLAVCGHIHEGAGQEMLSYDRVQQGREAALLNKAGISTLAAMLLARIPRTPKDSRMTCLVNAAVQESFVRSTMREAVVVEI